MAQESGRRKKNATNIGIMRSTKKNKRRLRRRVSQRGGDRVTQPTDMATAISGVGSIYSIGQTAILAEAEPTTTLSIEDAFAAGVAYAVLTINEGFAYNGVLMNTDGFASLPANDTVLQNYVATAASEIFNPTFDFNTAPTSNHVFMFYASLVTNQSSIPYLTKIVNDAAAGNRNSNAMLGFIVKYAGVDFRGAQALTAAGYTGPTLSGGGKKTHKNRHRRRTRGRPARPF